MKDNKKQNKYNMTVEQNIFVAKRNIIDYIWRSAHLEGIDVTFPEIQKIYEGGNVGRLRVDEIVTINNLKHAWQFLLATIQQEIDFKYLCSIHALVGSNIVENAGNKRSAMLLANHEMIKNGVGVLTIPIDKKEEFGKRLIQYYETDDMTELKQFMYEDCIDGIEF